MNNCIWTWIILCVVVFALFCLHHRLETVIFCLYQQLKTKVKMPYKVIFQNGTLTNENKTTRAVVHYQLSGCYFGFVTPPTSSTKYIISLFEITIPVQNAIQLFVLWDIKRNMYLVSFLFLYSKSKSFFWSSSFAQPWKCLHMSILDSSVKTSNYVDWKK